MANFTEDSRLENWLKLRGVKFEYKTGVRFADLMVNWSGVNQGRPDSVPKDEALIEKYASAMDGGAVFPSPVIAKTAYGFEVLDGCQRLNAADLCGQTLFNAYLIKSDNPSVRASIRICANSVLNGTAPSQDWTISKIVDVLYEQHQFSAVDCAQWSGQPVKKIQIEIDSRDAANWLRCQGVNTTIKPCNQKGFLAAFARLAPFEDRSKLAKELPELVKQLQCVKASNNEAVHLLEQCLDVNRAKGANLQVQVASKMHDVLERPEIKARMTGPRSMHPIDNVIRSLASLVTSMRSAAKNEYHSDGEQSKQIMDMIAEVKRLGKKIVPRDEWSEIAEQLEAVA